MSFIIRKEKTMIKRIISAALCCAMLVPFASISPVTADAYGIDIMNFDYDDNVALRLLAALMSRYRRTEDIPRQEHTCIWKKIGK